MAYVIRAADGTVVAAYTKALFVGQDEVPDDAPDLWRYLNRNPVAQHLATAVGIATDDIVAIIREAELGMCVDRDAEGTIVVSYETAQRDGHERVPRSSWELQCFLAE